MNKIFKIIWNPATGSYSVASETAKNRGKKTGRRKLLASTLIAASGMLSTFAYADNVAGTPVVPAGHNSGDGWVIIGKNSTASQHTDADGASTAIGDLASALGRYSTSIGARSSAGGDASTALGVNAYASGNRSTAVGASADASGSYAMAMGVMAIAKGNYALAFGNESEATGEQSLALGRKALTNEANAIAIGAETEAAENATAVGTKAKARGKNSLALGANSNSTGESAIALGYTAEATGANALAFGQNAQASNTNTIALGQNSSASTANAIAIGTGSSAIGSNSLALGSSSSTGGNNSVAIGANSTADEDNVVSVGSGSAQRRIVNMAAGTISTDSKEAINGSQLYAISRSVADRLGGGADVASNGTIMGMSYKLKKKNFNNVGEALQYLDNETLHWDSSNESFSASYIVKNADGTIAETVAENKIINVKDGVISATSKDAVNGSQLNATKEDVATNTSNIALNTSEIATNTANIQANTTDITNLGDSLSDLQEDALLWDSNTNAFSAAHGTGTTSKITNVMDGAVTSASSDAINGSQLHGLSSNIANYFGGNAAVDASGNFTGPTYNIDGTDYSSVGDALAAIDTSVSDSLEDALLWDSNTNAFSAAHGTGTASKITNVMAGAVTSTSTDAINGSQLHDLSSNIVSYFGGDASVDANGNFTGPTYNIDGTDYTSVGDALNAIDVSMAGSTGDALMWDDNANTYNASHNGTASKITDVADGNIAAGSTDAVNGSQLNATNMLIQNIAGDTSESYTTENGGGINYVRTNDNGLIFNDASAVGVGSTAVGYNTVASGDSSVAIGQGSSSTIEGGIALGSDAMSNRVIAQGSQATSVNASGVTIGYDTTDEQLLGALSLGKDGESYRQIINVADGTEAHDVVTVRQLQNAIGSVTTTPVKYYHANSTAEDSLAIGEDSLAMGPKTVVNADAGIGVGLNAIVVQDAINGIAIGTNAQVNHAGSIAIGSGSRTSVGAETNYTAYNMDTPQNSVGEFSVGSEDGQRKITNVAAGSADSDAVNVGQLKVTDERVSQNTQNISYLNNQVGNLDTRVTNLENGMGDIITTGSTKYFKANSTGPDANAQGADSVAMGSGSIAAADNSVALGTGSVADEANTVSVGSSTNKRRITNVAAGVNDTDAVNVSQLKSSEAGSVRYDTKTDGSIDYSSITLGGGNGGTTRISNVSAGVENNDAVNYAQLKQSVQETKQYTDQRMAQMDSKLSKTESKLSGGIASAMAMTGLPQAYSPGASMASIGGGSYNGESAVALGVSMVSDNGRWVYKLQGSTNSQGEYSAAIGAGIQW